ncbi:MAG: AsmA family protein, partial [Bacteroidales bacterium]|nr:AsmA family protein [Bacteroidales bacterium]
MKQIHKYILWTLGSLFALFLVFSSIVYFAVLRDEEKIKNLVIGELNKSLTGEVSVEHMTLTFWSSFPYIALDFRNVKAMGSNPNDLEPLLEAKRMSLNFNLRDMMAKRYEVKRIEVSSATIRIKLYADGTENFNLWKSTEPISPGFSFTLKKILLRNTQLIFLNERSEQRYELFFYRANAKGDFSANLQDISFSGDFHLDLLQSNETIILSEKDMSLRTQLQIDNSKQIIHFLEGFIRLEDLNFNLSGFINYSKIQANMDLKIIGKNLNLQRFIQQLPTNFAQKVESYRTKGNFDFRLNLSGDYTRGNLPKITAEWAFRDGQIYEKNTKTNLNKVQFSGTFSTSNINQLSNCRLQIRDFSAYTESGYLSANFAISNFQSPTIQLNTAFNIRLEELTELISIPQLVKASGASSGQIQYRHTFNSFESIIVPEILKGQFQGEMSCKNTVVKLQDSILKHVIKLDTIQLKFDQNLLQIPIAKGEFDGSKFQTSLTLHNFWSNFNSPELMHISGDLSVDKYQVDKILLQNLHGHIQYQRQILFIDGLSMNIFDGHVNGVAEVNFSETSRLPFRFEGELSNINA